jgi:hypothetical protein
MSRIRLYFDEDAMQQGLITALRARRVAVVTALDAGMANKPDEEHLARASRDGRVLYSFNIADYCSLHEKWLAAGRLHSGIVLAHQQRFSLGEQLRRLLYLLNRKSAEEMRCRLEYLSNWRP